VDIGIVATKALLAKLSDVNCKAVGIGIDATKALSLAKLSMQRE